MPTTEEGTNRDLVTPVKNLSEFFRDALNTALVHQHVTLEEHTSHYVVSLLTAYARTEVAYQELRPGQRWISLTELLASAAEAASQAEREAWLQRLGDISLFLAGFFADGFERRLVDVDYHISMGKQAYGAMAAAPISSSRRTLRAVFGELAHKFQPVVDAIADISNTSRVWGPNDVLRLYELWLKTGSRRAQCLLHRLGVTPVSASLQLS